MLSRRQQLALALSNHRVLEFFVRRFIRLPECRTIVLTNTFNKQSLVERRCERIAESQALFHNVLDDLCAFTGMTEEEIMVRLKRQGQFHPGAEHRWYAPENERALGWFYRSCQSFLYSNSTHPYWTRLDTLDLNQGRVLDYGAGVGANALTLACRGFDVDVMETSIIQQEFIKFRCQRHDLNNMRVIDPYANGKFDAINCVQDMYYAIILQDVLEHIPNYHVTLRHLIGRLQMGGLIIENTQFASEALKTDVHLKASMPLAEAMVGMKEIDKDVWKKVA